MPADVKAFVVEHSAGRMRDEPWELPGFSLSRHDETYLTFLREVLRSGRKLVAGETFITPDEEHAMLELIRDESEASKTASRAPLLANIKDYFVKASKVESYRHGLIKRTIKELAAEGKVDGQYGTRHSLLHHELVKDGVDASRTVRPQLFGWNSIVIRKLAAGMSPDDISDVEYKRAFAESLMPAFWLDSVVCGKPSEKLSVSDVRFSTLVQNALFDRLTEEQLDRVIKEDDIRAPFTINGLPDPVVKKPTKAEIIAFLDRNM